MTPSTSERNTATFLHLSTLTQYLIPFGNYILPIIIWSAKKNESTFVDSNGKNVLNFQLSMLLYSLLALIIIIPIFIYSVIKGIVINNIEEGEDFIVENLSFENASGFVILGIIVFLVFCFIKIVEFILIIYGSVKASNGEAYKYPLTISFIK
jgi:uncharacterized Tic20 family protein